MALAHRMDVKPYMRKHEMHICEAVFEDGIGKGSVETRHDSGSGPVQRRKQSMAPRNMDSSTSLRNLEMDGLQYASKNSKGNVSLGHEGQMSVIDPLNPSKETKRKCPLKPLAPRLSVTMFMYESFQRHVTKQFILTTVREWLFFSNKGASGDILCKSMNHWFVWLSLRTIASNLSLVF